MSFNGMYMLVALAALAAGVTPWIYESYSGKVVSPNQYEQHRKRNTTFWCTNKIKPCDPLEGRRIDGSCNNLKHPSRGAPHTPGHHVLPLVFHGYNNSRKSYRGGDLPLSRKVRTTLLLEGRAANELFTFLLTYFWVFMSADVLSVHDTVNYLAWKTHCCEESGRHDPECISVRIPADDPVHRFSGERCMNLTKPLTFQSKGCAGTKHPPERIITSTSTFDLSQVYGNSLEDLLIKKRLFRGGLLKYEVVDGRVWPPSMPHHQRVCVANRPPRETRCHDTGDDSNGIVGTNLLTLWFWRHHNHVATELATVNPCWDDETLFVAAREINIAMAMQIFFYEMHPILLGEENLLKEGVLSSSLGYRDLYDQDVLPQVSLEYGFSLRWGHTIQDGIAKMYDTHGKYLKQEPISNLILRTGFLAVDDNIDYLTQGAFRQAAAKIDHAVDSHMAQSGLEPLQRLADITSSDLQKNRFLGIAPYVKYREYCFGENINTFDDLIQAIDPDQVELMKELYQDVKDIDLLAGIWVERPISGGRVPATLYCLTVDQLLRSVVSDRHWYERRDRPNAFTIDQLLAVRTASISNILCSVGDKVTKIQPKGFLLPGHGNEIVSCEEIPKVDFHAWADGRCQK